MGLVSVAWLFKISLVVCRLYSMDAVLNFVLPDLAACLLQAVEACPQAVQEVDANQLLAWTVAVGRCFSIVYDKL